MSIKQRWSAKTPKFWKKVQRIAITVGAIAGVIIAAPITLPVAVVTVASYAITVGTVAATLSQLTVETNDERKELH
jgi:lipopolysaccharide/colanic/teichoic acid biosynthesis glycosyltransferase